MMKEAIKNLTDGKDLSPALMESSMLNIMEGSATPAQIAAFLTALKMKSETPEEISTAAAVMRRKALTFNPEVEKLVDTCGTGGDGLYTFNVSTLVALTIATFGVAVAKHGNRSVSSSCGSADLIESLGIPLIKEKEILKKSIENVNFGYIFAPYFHPAMKYATPVRKEMGVRTIFNILGPLANPAAPQYQILGVYDAGLLDPVANALRNLNLQAALVVHADDAMDEISLSGTTQARLLKKGKIERLEIVPGDFGIKKTNSDELRVNSKEEATEKAYKVMQGIECPELEMVALNAGWTLFMLDEVDSPKAGYEKAKTLLKQGKVEAKLEQIRSFLKNATAS